jgi:hypothetical protein
MQPIVNRWGRKHLRREVGVIDGYGLNQCYGILAYPGRNAKFNLDIKLRCLRNYAICPYEIIVSMCQ